MNGVIYLAAYMLFFATMYLTLHGAFLAGPAGIILCVGLLSMTDKKRE